MKNLQTYEEFLNEEASIFEGAVKAFEMDYLKMIKNIKSGYGWIDPEFVADTWENSSDTIDFEIVKDEIYNRLIKAGLLFFADEDDEEEKGKKITSIKQIKESVNEGKNTEILINNLSDIDHTRITKWLHSNINDDKYDLKRKKGKDFVLDISKASSSEIDSIKNYLSSQSYINESKDEFSTAIVVRDEEDLPEGTEVRVDALEYSSKGDGEMVKIIKPDGNESTIIRNNLKIQI